MPSSPKHILASECIRTLVLLREGETWASALVVFVLEGAKVWGEGQSGSPSLHRSKPHRPQQRCLGPLDPPFVGPQSVPMVTGDSPLLQPGSFILVVRENFLPGQTLSLQFGDVVNQVQMVLHPGCLYSYVVPMCSLCEGSHNRGQQAEQLNQQRCTVSWFWRPEAPNQGIGRLGSF